MRERERERERNKFLCGKIYIQNRRENNKFIEIGWG